jgi:threonylcarbamoyladenosine tRNA methylthiotransferase MtaB
VRYAIVTFGCRVNQADSQRLEAELLARGARPASPEEADLVVVNTCSVTGTADQSARQAIRRLHRLNARARLVVTGCYATRDPEAVGRLPGVWRLVPNADKDRLIAAIAPELGLTTVERFGDGPGPCGAPWQPGFAGRTVFTLRVQTGCDEQCSYCIIPRTRGPGRSLPLGAVLAEVDRAVRAGFREIVLTGVHLGSYGRDLAPPLTLCDLVAALEARAESVRFRLSSVEPMDCTRSLIDLVAGGTRVAPHFHLPLQHASDRILAAMRRPYRLDDYRRLVDEIRERLPQAAIGSDLIVGFPGETDDDFDRLVAYLERSPLTQLHVFPYSDRPDTEAASLTPKVPPALVRERVRIVRAVGETLARRFRERQVGAVRPGLTLEDGTVVLTDNGLKVRVPAGLARNVPVRVRIETAVPELVGSVVA